MTLTIEQFYKRTSDIQSAVDKIFTRRKKISSLQEAAIWKVDSLALVKLLSSFQGELVKFKDSENILLE